MVDTSASRQLRGNNLHSTPQKLAVHGGHPVKSAPTVNRPIISKKATADVLAVLESGVLARFYGGTEVRKFEEEYASWFGSEHAVAVSSGTAALHLAFLAADLPPASEVLVPANAYVSVVSALLQADLIPVVVDIDADSWTMDAADAAHKVNDRTVAIVAVHMYGQACPMRELDEIAGQHNLGVIEDCSQSHGATVDGRLTGTFGIAATFSLCCLKHVAMGEGGAIITDHRGMAERMRSLAHKGKGEGWLDYKEMGYSYNLTEVQAVLGRHSLSNLTNELATRREQAEQLKEALADTCLEFADIPSGQTNAHYRLQVMLPPELRSVRDEFVDAVRGENVGCDPSHPSLLDIAWFQQQRPAPFGRLPEALRPDYSDRAAPVAGDLLARQFVLDLGHSLTTKDIDDTATAVRKVLAYYKRREQLV